MSYDVITISREFGSGGRTIGKEVAEIALNSGANDMGSIMIEENVVSSAGASTRFDKEAMQATIRRAGFTPRLRNQLYEYRD